MIKQHGGKVSRAPRKHTAIVQALDIYPTIVELALGVEAVPERCPPNSTYVKSCVEGTSLVPYLLDDVNSGNSGNSGNNGNSDNGNSHEHGEKKVARRPKLDAAFAQWPGDAAVGYTIRSSDFRYTEWVAHNTNATSSTTPNWNDLLASELYDHRTDPGELTNVAGDATYAKHIKDLSRALHAQREPPKRGL